MLITIMALLMTGGVVPPEPPIPPSGGIGEGVGIDVEGERRKRLIQDDEDIIILLASWMTTNKN